MKVIEFGAHHQQTVLLLHGGGLSWWNYRQAAQLLCSRYHVVLPVLDGHSGSDAPFTTIENNAEAIIRWVDSHLEGKTLLMGGVSLGGQVLLEVLARRPEICRYAVVESTLVFPMKWTAAMIRPAYALCYPLIQKRWFARLQFRFLRIRPELFEEYYADTAAISQRDLTAFLEANARYRLQDELAACPAQALVVAGSRELPVIKRSAKATAALLPHAEYRLLRRYSHGELSLNHAGEYVDLVLKLLNA